MLNIKPHITEKSVNLVKASKYTYLVPRGAKKSEIEEIIFRTFKVKPLEINIICEKSLSIMRQGKTRSIRGLKKAIVTIGKKDSLPGFEIATEEAAKEKKKVPTEASESIGKVKAEK